MATGGLSPIAPCGLTSLYLRRHNVAAARFREGLADSLNGMDAPNRDVALHQTFRMPVELFTRPIARNSQRSKSGTAVQLPTLRSCARAPFRPMQARWKAVTAAQIALEFGRYCYFPGLANTRNNSA